MTSKILDGGSTTQDTTDGTKLLVKSVCETAPKSFSGPSPVYQELSMHHDWPVNPLSPNIHVQILQTELYTFP